MGAISAPASIGLGEHFEELRDVGGGADTFLPRGPRCRALFVRCSHDVCRWRAMRAFWVLYVRDAFACSLPTSIVGSEGARSDASLFGDDEDIKLGPLGFDF